MPVAMLLILVAVAHQRHVLIPAGYSVLVDSTDDGRGLLDTVRHPRCQTRWPIGVNLDTAEALGLMIPQPFPLRACEVIE